MAQFVLALLVGLALLTWAASGVVQTTAREWFERDVSSRAQLAMVGLRQSLANGWYGDNEDLTKQLTDLTRDDRVMGAAACDSDLTPRASTPGFPEEFGCWAVGSRLRTGADGQFHEWSNVATLPTGRVHVSVMPVTSYGGQLGFAILLHDMSYIERREATARRYLLIGFGVLAILAFGVPMFVAKQARYSLRSELRRVLQGTGKQKDEFQPILSDVRDLVGRMANEREDSPGVWTAERLRQALNRHLHGERIIILANREPYVHQFGPDGQIEVQHPASGLVTALEPVMRACSGIWVAHGSGSADRVTVDRNDRVRVPPGEESYQIRRVWLSEEEQNGYYFGFSNEGLWPLCHVAHARPIFRTEDWRQYKAVNQRFADQVCAEADSKDPIVLVQDYHFALAPAMIRKRLPAATVIAFWHIPWPNAERMGICPWRDEILKGLLGSSF
ncbi:MAG: Alpha,alpha-trehalose-phosphate synthase (UDP-forming), partial [Bryobacterales bacterium]|nr:Alpha,alpha-trehalose-phosphate synthase (UDP-forming) [Bryobacterales bacterium]